MVPDVTILRLGHRPQRDKRLTTHVCLTARAFGAERVVFPSTDSRVDSTVEDVTERFGGPFEIVEEPSWRELIREWEGPSMHLTMYGQPHTDVLAETEGDDEVLVVLGAEKVPRAVYDLVDYNVAVGNQPHSEVAALAVVLYELKGPEALRSQRVGAEVEVLPSARGKRIVETDDR